MTILEAQGFLGQYRMWLEKDLDYDSNDEWVVYEYAFGMLHERREVTAWHSTWQAAFAEAREALS